MKQQSLMKSEFTRHVKKRSKSVEPADHRRLVPRVMMNYEKLLNSFRNLSNFANVDDLLDESKNSQLTFKKSNFIKLFDEIHKSSSEGKLITFKKRTKLLIQHLVEEFMVFWFSQVNLISTTSNRKTITRDHTKLYKLLIENSQNFY